MIRQHRRTRARRHVRTIFLAGGFLALVVVVRAADTIAIAEEGATRSPRPSQYPPDMHRLRPAATKRDLIFSLTDDAAPATAKSATPAKKTDTADAASAALVRPSTPQTPPDTGTEARVVNATPVVPEKHAAPIAPDRADTTGAFEKADTPTAAPVEPIAPAQPDAPVEPLAPVAPAEPAHTATPSATAPRSGQAAEIPSPQRELEATDTDTSTASETDSGDETPSASGASPASPASAQPESTPMAEPAKERPAPAAPIASVPEERPLLMRAELTLDEVAASVTTRRTETPAKGNPAQPSATGSDSSAAAPHPAPIKPDSAASASRRVETLFSTSEPQYAELARQHAPSAPQSAPAPQAAPGQPDHADTGARVAEPATHAPGSDEDPLPFFQRTGPRHQPGMDTESSPSAASTAHESYEPESIPEPEAAAPAPAPAVQPVAVAKPASAPRRTPADLPEAVLPDHMQPLMPEGADELSTEMTNALRLDETDAPGETPRDDESAASAAHHGKPENPLALGKASRAPAPAAMPTTPQAAAPTAPAIAKAVAPAVVPLVTAPVVPPAFVPTATTPAAPAATVPAAPITRNVPAPQAAEMPKPAEPRPVAAIAPAIDVSAAVVPATLPVEPLEPAATVPAVAPVAAATPGTPSHPAATPAPAEPANRLTVADETLMDRLGTFLRTASGTARAQDGILRIPPPAPLPESQWINEPRTGPIQPGERLMVSIAFAPNATREVLVGSDGRFAYRHGICLTAGGLEPAQTAAILHDKLRLYYGNPSVTVMRVYRQGRTIGILGTRQHDGLCAIEDPTTALDLFNLFGWTASMTGPLAPPAMGDGRAAIIRRGAILPLDTGRLMRRHDLRANRLLYPGDVLILPEDGVPGVRTAVVGAVSTPTVWDAPTGASAFAAVQQAGGTTAPGATIHIVRVPLVDGQIYHLDADAVRAGTEPDLRLEPHDILFVSQTSTAPDADIRRDAAQAVWRLHPGNR